MEAVRRSNSLDLGKSTRFDFGVDRNRNDSGCFEDFDVMNVAANHDPVVTYWEEAVYQWSERARFVQDYPCYGHALRVAQKLPEILIWGGGGVINLSGSKGQNSVVHLK